MVRFGLVWFYGISTIVGYLIPNPVFTNVLNILFVNTFCRYTQLSDQSVLFLTILFGRSHLFALSSISPIDWTLSGSTTPRQSGPESNGNKGVLCILQSSSITGASQSDCLMSYPGHSLRESYLSADLQLVYSITPANWDKDVKIFKNNWFWIQCFPSKLFA